MRINNQSPQALAFMLNRPKQADATENNATPGNNTIPGVYTSLSALGKAKAKAAEQDKDIDDSNLPDTIKQLLKIIRDLKRQIAAKQAEIDKVMQDGLPAEQQQEALKPLQSGLLQLNMALNNTQQSLSKALQQQNLSDEQIQTALTLLQQ
jgi:RecA/RadA recombinase